MMDCADSKLIQQAKDGDINAFGGLVKKYEKKVYRFAYRLTGNGEDANDLAQEAFLRAFRALSRFRGDASFATWLLRITGNACLDELRRKRRHKLESLDMRECEIGYSQCLLTVPVPQPEQVAENEEISSYLNQAMQLLNTHHRQVITLHDLQGYTYEEIAGMLHCSIGTVKSRLSRGRSKLRGKIIGNYPELYHSYIMN